SATRFASSSPRVANTVSWAPTATVVPISATSCANTSRWIVISWCSLRCVAWPTKARSRSPKSAKPSRNTESIRTKPIRITPEGSHHDEQHHRSQSTGHRRCDGSRCHRGARGGRGQRFQGTEPDHRRVRQGVHGNPFHCSRCGEVPQGQGGRQG